MPSNSFLQNILPQRPRKRPQDVDMNNVEGSALGLVPTSSHPLQEERLDTVPRPMLIDNGTGSSSASTSDFQPISTPVQQKTTVQPPDPSIPSVPALGSPFQFTFGEKRHIKPRKRPHHHQGRPMKFKGTEHGPILEESGAEKTRVVEQQALATRQLIDQKGAELEAQAKKTHFIEQEGLATKRLLEQREERIVELEDQVNVYKTELSKVMARLDKLEGDLTKKDDVSDRSAGQGVVVSAPNSSHIPLSSGEDIQMASAIKERAAETRAESSPVAKDAEEQNQEITGSKGNDSEGDDSEDSDSEDSDFDMHDGDKKSGKGKGKEDTGGKHRRAASNNGDDISGQSSSDDEDDNESSDEKPSVPKPIFRFQRPRGGAGPRLRVDPTKPFNPTPKPPTYPTDMPTSGVQSLGITPEQIAGIVQIVLATQVQNAAKSVAPVRTKKKNVTGTIAEQSNREKDPRTGVLVTAIREHMNKLLQLKRVQDVRKLPQPTKEIVEAFADGEGRGPKLIPMELAFAYKKKEPWNARLAEMFFDDFLEHQGRNLGVQKSEWPKIYVKFWQRFSNLKKEWKSWQAKEGEDVKEVELRNSLRKKKTQKVTRRDARRNHLQELRIEITDGNKTKPDGSVDDVWYFLWIVATRLGLGGTSSDESSVESGSNPRKFFIKSVAWRSRELVPYLQIIDRDFNRFNRYGNSKPGNPYRERTRLAGATPSTRSAIKGLPLNFYDKTWLSNLTNEELCFLQPEPEIAFPVIIAYND